jgi:Fe-S cluster biogenesis protein NfuA
MSEDTTASLQIVPETTPNPNSVRFTVNRTLLTGPGRDFWGAQEAEGAPLVKALFALPGVAGVFVGPNFVTVTTLPGAEWAALSPRVVEALTQALASGQPLFPAAPGAAARPDNEVEAGIVRILEEQIRPALSMDGGDVVFVGFKDGIVRLHLQGACQGCPGATLTLKWGIERILKREFAEVVAVEAV